MEAGLGIGQNLTVEQGAVFRGLEVPVLAQDMKGVQIAEENGERDTGPSNGLCEVRIWGSGAEPTSGAHPDAGCSVVLI